MANVFRGFIDWTGNVTGSAASTFHFREPAGGVSNNAYAADIAEALDAFIAAVGGLIGAGVNLQTRAAVDILTEASGVLTVQLPVTVAAARAGGGEGAYSRASGCVIGWGTPTIVNGRRVRGRTFLVPLGGNAYDTAGTLSDVGRGNLVNAATGLITNPDTELGIYHRPVAGVGGVLATVATAAIKDKVAILRSRRD